MNRRAVDLNIINLFIDHICFVFVSLQRTILLTTVWMDYRILERDCNIADMYKRLAMHFT
jgi:hypothetical protein